MKPVAVKVEYNKGQLTEYEIKMVPTAASVDSTIKEPILTTFFYTLQYYTCNAFFIKQDEIIPAKGTTGGHIIQIVSRIHNILITTLLVLAGFAIRRKFRT